MTPAFGQTAPTQDISITVVSRSAALPANAPTRGGSGAIDISGPGGDFQRSPAGDWYTDMCLSACLGTGYAWMAGTSMATPRASGVAAQIIDAAKAQGFSLQPQQVVARVQQTAIDLGKVGVDPLFGEGMVSPYFAPGGQ